MKTFMVNETNLTNISLVHFLKNNTKYLEKIFFNFYFYCL